MRQRYRDALPLMSFYDVVIVTVLVNLRPATDVEDILTGQPAVTAAAKI